MTNFARSLRYRNYLKLISPYRPRFLFNAVISIQIRYDRWKNRFRYGVAVNFPRYDPVGGPLVNFLGPWFFPSPPKEAVRIETNLGRPIRRLSTGLSSSVFHGVCPRAAFLGSPTWIRNLLEPLHARTWSAWAQPGSFTIFRAETEGVVRGSRFECKRPTENEREKRPNL